VDRTILHCDINNCYASIETMLNPQYKGKPIAVCGLQEERHGIVLAKSEEAKVFGVKTGEVIWQAKQKCPELIIVPPHYEEYLRYSKLIRNIYYDYTNQVEPFGIDECWLDCTGSIHLFGSGEKIANELKERVKKEIGVTISVGVSFNKVFAKIGSDLKKPDAITVILKENFKEILWPLSIKEMIGIGKATSKKLENYGIYTLGELARTDPKFLKRLLGVNGVALWNYANGRDYTEVKDAFFKPPIKSIGHSITCTADLLNEEEVENVFLELSIDISRRLIENDLEASGVQISVRNENLFTKQYQKATNFPTQSAKELAQTAMEAFRENYIWNYNIRSLGIRAINLKRSGSFYQIDVFNNYIKHEKNEKINKALYQIRSKFGNKSITFGSILGDIKIPKERPDVVTLPSGSYI